MAIDLENDQKEYAPKHDNVKAFQWHTGDRVIAGFVEDLNGQMVVNSFGPNPTPVKDGDWLISFEDGQRLLLPDQHFRAIFDVDSIERDNQKDQDKRDKKTADDRKARASGAENAGSPFSEGQYLANPTGAAQTVSTRPTTENDSPFDKTTPNKADQDNAPKGTPTSPIDTDQDNTKAKLKHEDQVTNKVKVEK